MLRGHLPDVYTHVDDMQLYLSFKPNSDMEQQDALSAMELCVKTIHNWMRSEKLKIDDKTEFLITRTKQTATGESQS